MKGELIKDFSKLEIGDKIENKDGDIYCFISCIGNNNEHFDTNALRTWDNTVTKITSEHKFYHHIEDKLSIIDYVDKWYYLIDKGNIGKFFMSRKGLCSNETFEDFDKILEYEKDGIIIIKDTLEEIKEVYRAKNTTGNNHGK